MNDRALREELARVPIPEEAPAEERAWRLVSTAFEDLPATRPRAARWRPVAVVAIAAAGLGVALSPAGAEVGDWIRDAVRPGTHPSRPALASLPGPGRLLVVSEGGTWIVRGDGSKRRLGAYEQAAWSPRGLFVAATRGRQLVALDPQGQVRWSLTRPDPRHPAWAPLPGDRVAYLSGGSLRVVAGDGTGDRLVAGGAAHVRPAWRPGARHEVAYAGRDGSISLVDADARRRVWRAYPGPAPSALAWTPDGRRLVVLSRRSLHVLGRGGRELATVRLPAGSRPRALAVDPAGRNAAIAVRERRGGSSVRVFRLDRPEPPGRPLFAGQGQFTDLAWSPDGRWLLIAWQEADQWVFVRSTRVRKIDAVSNIRREFDPGGAGATGFPRLAGWCCAPPGG